MVKKKVEKQTPKKNKVVPLKVEVSKVPEEPRQSVENVQPVLSQPGPVKKVLVVVNPRSVVKSVIVEVNGKRYKKNYRPDGTTDLDPLE